MTTKKFAKSVSFNTKNDEDNLILKHIKRRNFSGYVKDLILKDIEKGGKEKVDTTQNKPSQAQVKKAPPADRLERIKKKQNEVKPQLFTGKNRNSKD